MSLRKGKDIGNLKSTEFMSQAVEESLWKGLWNCGQDIQRDKFDDDDYDYYYICTTEDIL